MKVLFMSLCLVLLTVASAAPPKYTNRYDNLNIDDILGNERTLNSYIKCLLDDGPCTAEGKELKAHIPEALSTACELCTTAQITFMRKGSKYLLEKKPDAWKKIQAHYDPEEKYQVEFKKFVYAE